MAPLGRAGEVEPFLVEAVHSANASHDIPLTSIAAGEAALLFLDQRRIEEAERLLALAQERVVRARLCDHTTCAILR
jgi:hypothetical protein